MRWRPKQSKGMPWWIWLFVPLWGVPVAALFLAALAAWAKRRLLGPTEDWRPWFAWHPIKVADDDGWPLYHRVWLEWVERRANHVCADPVYRHPSPLPRTTPQSRTAEQEI